MLASHGAVGSPDGTDIGRSLAHRGPVRSSVRGRARALAHDAGEGPFAAALSLTAPGPPVQYRANSMVVSASHLVVRDVK